MREQRDAELTGKIVEIHDESRLTYGSPRVHRELRAQGERCSRKRVVRLMQAAGRHGRVPRRWKKTTIPDPDATTRPDLIGRDFAVDPDQPGRLDRRWCGDITYIHTWEGWLYLATVIDLASRRVVGWATADHLRADLVADALTDAINRRRPAPGVAFHSDRGCQGGFNWSSQHLDHGGVGWDDRGSRCRRRRLGRDGSGPRTGRCGRRCARRAAPSRRELSNGSSGV
ncbi:IS3 family transposase [Kribbella sp. NBC_00359]|uniref:IS3 family transposase n=1 Tax=Kribbella sp. NBC_00359 TaxID=2975966 RepID=UPI002E1DA7BA